MSIQHKYAFTPGALSANGFLTGATGATWTLSVTTPTDTLAHKVTITNNTANSHSGKTALLTGTDADGNPQSETLALPAGSVATTSVKYYKTLTSIVPSATIGADTMGIGWNGALAGPTICLNHHNYVGALVQVDISGTINYSIEISASRRDQYSTGQDDLAWIPTGTTALVGATADKAGTLESQAAFARFVTASLSSGATATVYVSEANKA